MVNSIGGSGAGRAGIEAALKGIQKRAQKMGSESATGADANSAQTSFGENVKSAIEVMNSEAVKVNELQNGVLSGELDLHEVAAQIKESQLTVQFSLQVRNKLMDAYREVMRMSV